MVIGCRVGVGLCVAVGVSVTVGEAVKVGVREGGAGVQVEVWAVVGSGEGSWAMGRPPLLAPVEVQAAVRKVARRRRESNLWIGRFVLMKNPSTSNGYAERRELDLILSKPDIVYHIRKPLNENSPVIKMASFCFQPVKKVLAYFPLGFPGRRAINYDNDISDKDYPQLGFPLVQWYGFPYQFMSTT
jgi:hypothetical protein